MHFLPDVFVTCETCKGSRYNRETLEITYRHKTISDVLDMTVEEAVKFFDAHPKILRMLQCLHDVGLDYVQLGQPPRRSPGRAQRIKLASELGNTVGNMTSPHTLYVLDEPTTGLHFADVDRLIGVLNRLADAGHTLVVIEHNLDVIKRRLGDRPALEEVIAVALWWRPAGPRTSRRSKPVTRPIPQARAEEAARVALAAAT